MPITVCRKKEGSDSFSGNWEGEDGESYEKRSASRSYIAAASGYASPGDVGPADVKAAAGVPVPGQSIYVSEEGRVYPYCLCRSVEVSRRQQAGFIFDITASFEEPENGGQETDDPPADPELLTPSIVTQLTSFDVTLWEDPVNSKPYLLPNGMLYNHPLVGKRSGLRFEITQYENSFDAQNMVGRAHIINNQDKSIGGITYKTNSLMVTDIKWDSGVKWLLDPYDEDGPFVLTNRVKYIVEWKEYNVSVLDDDGGNSDIRCHWGSLAIDASSHYLTVADDYSTRRLINNNLFQAYGSAYIKSDGTIHHKLSQGGIPPQRFFNSQVDGDFSFLRT